MDKSIATKSHNEIMHEIRRLIGDGADVMVTSFKDGTCRTLMKGSADNIAQAILCCMHDSSSQAINDALFKIIKLNTMAILHSASPYALELSEAINNVERLFRLETERKTNSIKLN